MDDQQTPPPVVAEVPVVTYQDEDLVYVDPDARVVIGRVEWLPSGKPKALAIPDAVKEEPEIDKDTATKEKRRPRRQRYYPWGTYRSMKRLFKIDGHKQSKPEAQKTLEEVIEKALTEPFWD